MYLVFLEYTNRQGFLRKTRYLPMFSTAPYALSGGAVILFIDKAKIFVKAGTGVTARFISVVRNMLRRAALTAATAAEAEILYLRSIRV
jgi:hypothetical protein